MPTVPIFVKQSLMFAMALYLFFVSQILLSAAMKTMLCVLPQIGTFCTFANNVNELGGEHHFAGVTRDIGHRGGERNAARTIATMNRREAIDGSKGAVAVDRAGCDCSNGSQRFATLARRPILATTEDATRDELDYASTTERNLLASTAAESVISATTLSVLTDVT